MAIPLQRVVATHLAGLYLLIAAAGQGLHVHDHGLEPARSSAEPCGGSCGCLHTADRETVAEIAYSAGADGERDRHECVACSLLAQMRLADNAEPPRLIEAGSIDLPLRVANEHFSRSAIYRPIARGPPSDV